MVENIKHIPVLLNEVLSAFASLPNGSTIVDCTLGLGGHTKALLDKGYVVVGLDRDENAISHCREKLKGYIDKGRLIVAKSNFIYLKDVLAELNIDAVNGILIDTGISTYQLEDEKRGFGFSGKLDMRMDVSQELTAEKIVDEYDEEELAKILFDYGERVYAKQIAHAIVIAREKERIDSAEKLVDIIAKTLPEQYKKTRKHHYATPTFRALRIAVNNDINNIKIFLDNNLSCLKKDGVLALITFHTIEDRFAKNRLKEYAAKKIIKLITKKPIAASKKEISQNRKAARARLWIAQKR